MSQSLFSTSLRLCFSSPSDGSSIPHMFLPLTLCFATSFALTSPPLGQSRSRASIMPSRRRRWCLVWRPQGSSQLAHQILLAHLRFPTDTRPRQTLKTQASLFQQIHWSLRRSFSRSQPCSHSHHVAYHCGFQHVSSSFLVPCSALPPTIAHH